MAALPGDVRLLGRRRRIVGAALPLAMTAAVVLTANHFVLDAVAGGLLATVAWLAFRTTDGPGPRPALS